MPPACLLNAAGRQAKWDIHRTDHEEASGLAEIQWQLGISLDSDRLDKKRGSRVSLARFGDFCAYKSHPGSGGGTPGDQHQGLEPVRPQ